MKNMDLTTLIITILAGAGTGIGVALGGYFKNAGETFDLEQILVTALTGAIIGGIGGYLGLGYAQAETYLITTGLITIVYYIIKGFKRRVIPALKEKWGQWFPA